LVEDQLIWNFTCKEKTPSREYKQEFKSYVGFLYWAGELTDLETEAFKEADDWLIEVERTVMTESYNMIVLKYMLSRGVDNWLDPITPEEVAPFFHSYLTGKEYRKRIDFSAKAARQIWEYDKKKVTRLIATMSMTKWSESSNGKVGFKNKFFSFNIPYLNSKTKSLFFFTKEVCDFRLHFHFEKRSREGGYYEL
jgi:hypothetical protein